MWVSDSGAVGGDVGVGVEALDELGEMAGRIGDGCCRGEGTLATGLTEVGRAGGVDTRRGLGVMNGLTGVDRDGGATTRFGLVAPGLTGVDRDGGVGMAITPRPATGLD
jgi:hypothetical protein